LLLRAIQFHLIRNPMKLSLRLGEYIERDATTS
jgi:hypothetical protein